MTQRKYPKIFNFTNPKFMGLVGLWQKISQCESFYSFVVTKNIHWHIQRDFIVCIPSPLGDGVGVLSPFSEGFYSRQLGHIGILGGNWHFECRWFFSDGTWKFPVYIKIVNMNLKQKKKENDSDCNFYHFSLLVPYSNNFLVVGLCIVIFHGVYPTTLPHHFAGLNNFRIL